MTELCLSRKWAFLGLFDFLRERKSDPQVFYSSKFKRAFSFTFDFFAGYISAQKPAYCHKTEAGDLGMFQKCGHNVRVSVPIGREKADLCYQTYLFIWMVFVFSLIFVS